MSQRTWLIIVGPAFLLGGGCCIWNSSLVRQMAERVPRMTCDELIRNGPGPHPYVTLTDVRLCTGGYVFWRDGIDGNLDELCQPVYSAGLMREPKPRDLALVLRITDDQDREHLIGQPGVVEFTCAVRRGANQIDPGLVEGLEQKYPGIRLANCWVLTVGNLEPTAARAQSMMQYGLVLLAIGAAMVLAWFASLALPGRMATPDGH